MPETDPRDSGSHERDESGHLPFTGVAPAAASGVPATGVPAAERAGTGASVLGRAAQRRAENGQARKEDRSPNQLLLWLKEVATVVAIAIVLSFLIKTFLFRAFFIPSESMVNTLDVDDRIFVNLLSESNR